MSKVIKGAVLAGAILLTAGAAAFAAPAIFASAAFWSGATALATGAFLNGLSAQLAGTSSGSRAQTDVEYTGTVEPRRILYGKLRLSGMHAIPPFTSGTNNKFLHCVLVIAGRQINAITAVYFNQEAVGTIGSITGASTDGAVSTGTFAGKAWVRRYLGTASQTADFILDNALALWTSSHRGRGVPYIALQFEQSDTAYKTGKPDVTADAEGFLCYDPRLDPSPGASPTNPSYIAYTTNPALCLADYLMDAALGLGESATRIDWDMVSDAADICDEMVAIPVAATQKRYTCNIALLTTTPYEENIEALAACMLGSCLYSGGKWRLRAGAWEAPSFTIGDANIVSGGIDLDTAYAYRERWNGVRGTFFDPDNAYQPNEFPAVQSSAYVTFDGESVFKDVQFAGCTNVYEAQRNAIYLTRKSRNRQSATMQCDLSLWRVRPGATGVVTITELGWSGKTKRCEGWKFNPVGSIEVVAREELASDWNDPLEADYLTPLAISTPTPVYFTPDPPSSFSSSGTKYGIVFSWTAPALLPAGAVFELFEYTSNTPFSSATRIWWGEATTVTIQKNDTLTRYYWVRVRMPDGTVSTTQPGGNGLSGAIGSSLDFAFVATGNCVVIDKAFVKVGGTGAWDSSVYSLQAYVGGAFVSFRPAQTTLDVMVGLNTDPTTDSSYTSLDYAFHQRSAGGLLDVYESGVFIGTVGSYAVGDDLSISYDGALVRYLKNGSVLREVMAGPGRTFYLDSSFDSPGGTVTDVRFGPYGTAAPVLYNARGNCIVSDTNAEKVGGASAWDSDIYSLKGYPSCHVSFKPNQTNAQVMVGLSVAPLSGLDYTTISFAFYCDLSGSLVIYENGTSFGSFGTYTINTVLAVTYDGAGITYYKDGMAVRTNAVGAGYIFYLDSSFYTPGVGINSLRFGPTTNLSVADTSQIRAEAAAKVVAAYLATYSVADPFGVASVLALTTIAQSLDHTIQLTASLDIWCTTGSHLVSLAAVPTTGGPPFYESAARPIGLTASPGERLALQVDFPALAGTQYSVGLVVQGPNNGGTIQVRDAGIRAEHIKR